MDSIEFIEGLIKFIEGLIARKINSEISLGFNQKKLKCWCHYNFLELIW